MNRRNYLATVGAVSTVILAGCSEDPDVGTSDAGDIEAQVNILEHDFNHPEFGGGVEFEVTVENATDETQNINVVIEMYDNDFVIDNRSMWFDIPPNATSSDDRTLYDIENPNAVTHYIIRAKAGYGGEPEKLGEYDGDEFRNKLEG